MAAPSSRGAWLLALTLTLPVGGCGDSGGDKPSGAPRGGTGTQAIPPTGGGAAKPTPGGAPAAPSPAGAPAAAPIPVVLGEVTQRDVPLPMELTGQSVGFQDVEIRARVQGYLKSMDYKEGTMVKQGDLLYTIDPAEFTAAVERAKGDVVSAEAGLERASKDVVRYRALIESGAVSRRELDNAEALEKNAQGSVASAKAALTQAELDLEYTRITAPTAGLAGTTKVNVGNLVGRGDNTLLTTISVIDPILVRISISEAEFLKFSRKRAEDVKRGENPVPKPFRMQLADGSTYPHEGFFYTVERAVDQTTGTIRLDVKFDNPDKLLRPGNFAKLTVDASTLTGALLVPQRAVRDVQGQAFVAVVGAGDKVEMRRVKTGPKAGSDWVIEDGVKVGERVVVEGVNKVADGSLVAPTKSPSGT